MQWFVDYSLSSRRWNELHGLSPLGIESYHIIGYLMTSAADYQPGNGKQFQIRYQTKGSIKKNRIITGSNAALNTWWGHTVYKSKNCYVSLPCNFLREGPKRLQGHVSMSPNVLAPCAIYRQIDKIVVIYH